ncbi:MAG: hypothetical protein D6B25_12990 [Desulfobulbaceae bacterium]|nr:MAG: hypothetical protein D6B25_12990 [Desulfobulbaceae bacterium]
MNTTNDSKSLHPLALFEARVIKLFRMDLQLHFFWSFSLTILGLFWGPLMYSGIMVTLLKESLDWYAQKGWSWGDFWFGIGGAFVGFIFIGLQ